MTKRTKIIATLGPASSTEEAIERLILAGTDVFRLNFSHGTQQEQVARAELVRRIAARHNRYVALLGDLQGPKIRIQEFASGFVQLEPGQDFCLDTQLAADAGDSSQVGVLYRDLPKDCEPGSLLLLDDGRLEMEVQSVDGNRINCRVVTGGKLSNNKGINLAGGGLSAPALTEKDRSDLTCAAQAQLDYLAISFPKSADDMREAREQAIAAGFAGRLIAKIERSESVASEEAMDAIILASDAVMVARGDLGVEIGDAQLVGIQKRLILRARQLNRIVIVATQMMESMIESALPTRAEVFDVANAVLDGTDAVMLSAETAVGAHPHKVVDAMARVIRGAERERITQQSQHRLDRVFDSADETIAMAAMYAANHMKDIKALVSLTESGTTPLLMSRIRSGLPIFALSTQQSTLRRCALLRGVQPVEFEGCDTMADTIRLAFSQLCEKGHLQPGDRVIVTIGDQIGESGRTNTLKILTIG
mgnify:CR=1 FL=1